MSNCEARKPRLLRYRIRFANIPSDWTRFAAVRCLGSAPADLAFCPNWRSVRQTGQHANTQARVETLLEIGPEVDRGGIDPSDETPGTSLERVGVSPTQPRQLSPRLRRSLRAHRMRRAQRTRSYLSIGWRVARTAAAEHANRTVRSEGTLGRSTGPPTQ